MRGLTLRGRAPPFTRKRVPASEVPVSGSEVPVREADRDLIMFHRKRRCMDRNFRWVAVKEEFQPEVRVGGPELPTGRSQQTSQSELPVLGPAVPIGRKKAGSQFPVGTAGKNTGTSDWRRPES